MTSRELELLLSKYETLARWRAEREAGQGLAPREALRALATEYPGALRQLETLAWPTLRARIDTLVRALQEPHDSARVQLWMQLDAAMHATLRSELHRPRSERPSPADGTTAAPLLDRALSKVAADFGITQSEVVEFLELQRRRRTR